MSRHRLGPRVLGPYRTRDKFQVKVRDGRGGDACITFDTEELAREAAPGLLADAEAICAAADARDVAREAAQQEAERATRAQRLLEQRYSEPISPSRAGRLVREAKDAGLLTVPPVCSCGRPAKRIVAHHPDYQRPRDVRWLCDSCHRTLHNRQRRTIGGVTFAARKIPAKPANPPKETQ